MAPLIRLMYKEWDRPIPHDFNQKLPEASHDSRILSTLDTTRTRISTNCSLPPALTLLFFHKEPQSRHSVHYFSSRLVVLTLEFLQTIKKAMARFDVNESGTLSFEEFLQMLSSTPWRGLMPKHIRDSIVRAAQLNAGEPPAPLRNAKAMRDEACLGMIEALFHECDRDGNGEVDPMELQDLVHSIYRFHICFSLVEASVSLLLAMFNCFCLRGSCYFSTMCVRPGAPHL